LEESNKFLELLRDIVRQGMCILDFVVQALHEGSTFCRVIPLNISSIALYFYVIGGEAAICLLQCLQFSFCYYHTIWVPECHLQNCNQCWNICQVDALISDIGINLGEGVAH
jgi:hypothetical protein